MKKSILNLGETLNKAEQQKINGGFFSCRSSNECSRPEDCCSFGVCIDSSTAIMDPFCS